MEASLYRREQAKINECKGNLFEYLVAWQYSCLMKSEAAFITNLPVNYRERLSHYEKFLTQHFSGLTSSLQLLANKTALELQTYLKEKKIDRIFLVGKREQAHEREKWGEADIILYSEGEAIPISLKLSKKDTQIFTKNTGIKSFLTTYFPSPAVEERQKQVNEVVEKSFAQLSFSLHEKTDLNVSSNFSDWEESTFSDLPGKLPEELQKVVIHYYHQIAQALYNQMKEIFEQNPQRTRQQFLALCGLEDPRTIQVRCFYQEGDTTVQQYDFSQVSFLRKESIEEEKITLLSYRETSGFDIQFPDFVLKIRVKPSDRFTTESLKVIASIKY